MRSTQIVLAVKVTFRLTSYKGDSVRMDHFRDQRCSWIRVRDIVTLVIATVMLVASIFTRGTASFSYVKNFGFNQTWYSNLSNNITQITPDYRAFAIWGPMAGYLMVYALSFLFRLSTPRTVSWISLWLYTGTNAFGSTSGVMATWKLLSPFCS